MLRRILLLLPFLLPLVSFSQSDVEMADTFRSEGKIYVVIAVIAVIFIGLMIYLFMIERKISRIEKEIKNLSKR
jgi:CcmD family protein